MKEKIIVLDNGVKLVLCPDNTRNQTYAKLIVNYGGKIKRFLRDNKEYYITDGIAHLLEHTIVENNIYGGMHKYYKDKYVEFNASTDESRTTFYINTVLDFYEHLEELIKIVNCPIFVNDALKNTKGPIIDEIKTSCSSPNYEYNKKLNEIIYNNSEYRSVLGSIDDLLKADAEYLRIIHETFYQPSNQIIFIIGAFDVDKTIKLIEDIYNSLNKKKIEYKVLNKLLTTKFNNKYETIVDDRYDELISFSFKVDLSKLSNFNKMKCFYYLNYFLNSSFNDTSDVFKDLQSRGIIVYSIDRSFRLIDNDICVINICFWGNDLELFENVVNDVFKEKKYDEERFLLHKKRFITDMIIDSNNIILIAKNLLNNILEFDYYDILKIEDVEKVNIDDYLSMLNSLDFSSYGVVLRKKK